MRGTAALIVIVDAEHRITKLCQYNMRFKKDPYSHSYNPIDKIPWLSAVVSNGEKCIIRDNVHKRTEYDEFFDGIIESAIAVPIMDESNAVNGVLSVVSQDKNRFSDNELMLLDNLAEFTSVRIKKEILLNQINKIDRITSADLDHRELVHALKDIFEAHGCSLFLKEVVGSEVRFRLKASTGILGYPEAKYRELYYKGGESLTGYLAQAKRCIRLCNVKNAKEFTDKVPGCVRSGPKYMESPSTDENSPESYLGTCLLAGSEVLGVIRLSKGDPFTADDEITLRILSRHISSFIKLERAALGIETALEYEALTHHILDFAHDAKNVIHGLFSYYETICGWVPKERLADPAVRAFRIGGDVGAKGNKKRHKT